MAHGSTNPAGRMIGVALGARTTAEAKAAMRVVAERADIAEIRLDLMDEYDLPRLLRDRPCPVVVTNRAEREGGRFRGGEVERVRPLLEAIGLGAEYVDIEHDATHLIPDRGDTRLVVSFHDFQRTPPDPVKVYERLAAKGADGVKVVGMARGLGDNAAMLDLLARADLPTIAIAMGELGLPSRVLALRHRSCLLTYASLDDGETVAPGQIPISAMRRVYHADEIGPETSIYAVLSSGPVSDDLLASLNSASRRVELDAVWVPAVTSDTESAPESLAALRRLGVAGAIVQGAAQAHLPPALDSVGPQGPDGGVNFILLDEGKWTGGWAELGSAFARITGRSATIS